MPQLDFDGANSKISADKIQGQSGTTVTIPAGHNLVGDGSGLTSLPAANLTGTVATARLGSGTANSTTFLRGDQTYAAAGADGAGVSSFFSGFTSANNNITGDATYWNATSAAWTDLYNVGSDFNSGTYTAPQTGKYLLWGQWYMSGFTSSHNDLMCRLNTSNRTYRPILIHPWAIRPAATAVTINWSIIADMDISDTATIDIKVSGGTKVVDLHGDGTYQSQFTCYGGSLLA